MRRFTILVDAGYFWEQAKHIVHQCTGEDRDSIVIDYAKLRHELLDVANAQFPNAYLLRVYWYDGPGVSGKTDSHEAIEALDDFKLRMGVRSGVGYQKAVDGLLIADLINLAQNQSVSDVLLLSGDADLIPGVVVAQSLGIRVHLLTMGPPNATSPYLLAEVDRKIHWDDAVVRRFVSAATSPRAFPPNPPVAATSSTDWESIARTVYADLTPEDKMKILQMPIGLLPEEVDKALLRAGRTTLSRYLEENEKLRLRDALRRLAHSAYDPAAAPCSADSRARGGGAGTLH
jgi:uncharacterized LabA/DUF88 family protein